MNIDTKDIPQKLDKKKILMFQSLNKQEYIANDTLFKLKENDKVYFDITKPIHNNFEKHLTYYKKNLSIAGAGYLFNKMLIGIHKYYDENGNLIKEINYDENYNFTVDDLILKVKKEFQIDLNMDLERIEIRRGIHGFNFSTYTITIYDNGYSRWRSIVIDGTFGFIILIKYTLLQKINQIINLHSLMQTI